MIRSMTMHNDKTNFDTVQVDLKSTPYEHDETASKTMARLALYFGAFWLAIPLFILVQALSQPNFGVEMILILGLFVSIGAIIIAYGVHLLTSKRIITFHKDVLVIYTETLLKGKNRRTLPYSAFKGVLMDEYVQHRKNQPDLTFQTIELVHEDKSLTVQLYEKLGETPPRSLWKDYVSFMRVPALQKDGDSLQTLHPDDINLSLQQRSKRGYTKPTDFSAQDIPEGLEIQHKEEQDGDHIQIRILANRLTPAVIAMFALVPAGLAMLPFFTEASFVFTAFGALFLLVIGGMALQDHLNKRTLTITRTEISIEDIQPQNTHEKTVSKLSLSNIENILIKGESFNEHLVIIGKEGEMSTNTGLSEDTLKWLQNYLRAAVVTA